MSESLRNSETHLQKNKTLHFLTICKNQLKMAYAFKCKAETVEENTREIPQAIGTGKDFLVKTPQHRKQKQTQTKGII